MDQKMIDAVIRSNSERIEAEERRQDERHQAYLVAQKESAQQQRLAKTRQLLRCSGYIPLVNAEGEEEWALQGTIGVQATTPLPEA